METLAKKRKRHKGKLKMATRKEYKTTLKRAWGRYKRGQITREEFEIRASRQWDDFLAQEHIRDSSNRRIFKKLAKEAKDRYGRAKDRYYYKDINVQQYIWRRGLTVGMGMSHYESRLVELGLATGLMTTEERELFSWKSLKLEREAFPPMLRDPDNFYNCPPENELAAEQTMYIFLELMDYYNQNYVPSLSEDWIIRDMKWIELAGEAVAQVPPYLEVNLTPAQIANFENLRDGGGPPNGGRRRKLRG